MKLTENLLKITVFAGEGLMGLVCVVISCEPAKGGDLHIPFCVALHCLLIHPYHGIWAWKGNKPQAFSWNSKWLSLPRITFILF